MFEIVSGLNSVEHTNSEEPQTEEEEEFQNREKKKGVMITLILSLLTLFLIFETTQFTKIQLCKTIEKINYFGFLLIENLWSDVHYY